MTSRDPEQQEREQLTALILDSSRPIVERLAAIEVLVDQAPETAKLVMLSLGERVSEPREVLEAAGVGLARVEHSGVTISEFDLRDMSEVAFIAWHQWRPAQ
jgi:hypothetical protein